MYILGISCFYHDAAAAVLQDGLLLAAAEEERFSRRKHDFGYPHHAIDFCLREAGITARELDYVVFYEKPLRKFERLLLTQLQCYPSAAGVFARAMGTWLTDKLWIGSRIQEHLGLPSEKILFAEHHLSHAASAFFCSPYDEATVLTADGVGEWTTTGIGYGKATWNGQGSNELKLTREIRFPHSLGLLYSVFTAFLGFEVNEGEYKVMGMAPYGQPTYLDKVYQILQRYCDGSFSLNMNYLTYHHSHDRAFGSRFIELFGQPRTPETEFYTESSGLPRGYDPRVLKENMYYADVAASIQRATEEAMIGLARAAYEAHPSKRLCLAGGVAYNCLANTRILRETPFEELYIQPAAGDSGGALGAALYAYHVLLQQPRRFVMEHAYWGAHETPEAIEQTLRQRGVAYQTFGDEEALVGTVARAIADGKVAGWFQGRCEWGPRALGNRSIIADPRRADMKEIVNAKIKFREPFRPFAPSMLAEATHAFMDLPNRAMHYPAKFMLYVTGVQPAKQSVIPAVSHMGTARLQTVDAQVNPRYHRLIARFAEETGVPVLLNTSYNLRGEPLVNTAAHALSTFERSGLDLLAFEGRYLVSKG